MRIFLVLSLCLIAVAQAQSDATIASVQQLLKDQGFYYGEATGKKDADTTAALRRYQIRNGLQITGELNAETQKSLGVKGTIPQPPTRVAPAPAPRIQATPEAPRPRDDRPVTQEPARMPNEGFGAPPPAPAGVFVGTPYETAPLESQRRVIASVQNVLARRGYYRDLIDGEFGPGTQFALRAFQSRFGLEPNGRLDTGTLAALGLLPGQRAPGLTAPTRRSWHRPTIVAPNGEPIYEPR